MRDTYIVIDSETTQTRKIADFAAVVVDKKGNILAQCAILINGIFNDAENHPLFFTSDKDGIWSKAGQDKRYDIYMSMLDAGTRSLASVNAINRWLEKAKAQFNPVLTAYNLPFDLGMCHETSIDMAIFDRRFCLWAASFTHWGKSKKYRQFVLNNHAFNVPTEHGNMTFKTNAETMARFVLGNPALDNEPHTALEDILGYEKPMLDRLVKLRSTKWLLTEVSPYNWRDIQVKDWFKPI
jgi:hypothetical protein